MRSVDVCMLTATLVVFAVQNIDRYQLRFSAKAELAQSTGQAIRSTDSASRSGSAEEDQLATRRDLYTLLSSLGLDPSLHSGTPYGVVILDPDFYRGEYVRKPRDTILDACAIQPFSVPALTGLPLLSPFSPGAEICHYESYGYQYLPKRIPVSTGETVQSCALAAESGFTHLVEINKDGNKFAARRLDCAK